MGRIPAVAGMVAAAVGGYVVGRRRVELVEAVERLRSQATPVTPATPARGWDDETEYEHESEREVAERHRVADEIKRHPLRERTREPKIDERPTTGRGGRRRSDEDLGYPRPY